MAVKPPGNDHINVETQWRITFPDLQGSEFGSSPIGALQDTVIADGSIYFCYSKLGFFSLSGRHVFFPIASKQLEV